MTIWSSNFNKFVNHVFVMKIFGDSTWHRKKKHELYYLTSSANVWILNVLYK